MSNKDMFHIMEVGLEIIDKYLGRVVQSIISLIQSFDKVIIKSSRT